MLNISKSGLLKVSDKEQFLFVFGHSEMNAVSDMLK
jgi:hypothetical protein